MVLPQDPDKKPPKKSVLKQYGMFAPSALAGALQASIRSMPGPMQQTYLDVPGAASRRIAGLQHHEVEGRKYMNRFGVQALTERAFTQFNPHFEAWHRRITGGYSSNVVEGDPDEPMKWTEDVVARIREEVPIEMWDQFQSALSEYDLNKMYEELRMDREFQLAWETYSNTDKGAFMNTHRWMQQWIAPLMDPTMLIPYLGVAGVASKLTRSALAAKKAQAVYNLSKNAKKFAMVNPSLGFNIIGDTVVGAVYGKFLESEDPLRGANEYNEYVMSTALWAGVFGVGDGLLKGAQLSKFIGQARRARMKLTDDIIAEFGDDLGPLLAHAANAPASERRRLLERLEELRGNWERIKAEGADPGTWGFNILDELGLHGSVRRDIVDDFGNIITIGKSAEVDEVITLRVLEFLKNNEQAIKLERMLQTALLKGNSDPLRALTAEHVNILRRAGRADAADLADLLVNGHLSGETGHAQAKILNKLFEGKAQLLDKDDINWLLKHRPDILDTWDLDDLHKNLQKHRNTIKAGLKGRDHQIAMLREASVKAPKKVGDIVFDPKTGRVGRLIKIEEGSPLFGQGRGTIEPHKSWDPEIDKQIDELKIKREKLEGTGAHVKALKAIDDEIAELEASKGILEVDDVFSADTGTLARWEMLDRPPGSIKLEHDTSVAGHTETFKKGGKKHTFRVRFTATVFGRKVTIRRITNKNPKKSTHDWEVTVLGRDASEPARILIRPQRWWKKQLGETLKKTDVVYRRRINLQGTTQKKMIEEIQAVIKKEEIANIERRMIDDARAALLDLFPEQDTRNVLDMLSKGTLPRELRDMNIDIDTDILMGYINRTDVPAPVADDILQRAEGLTVLDSAKHDAETLDINNIKDKRTLNRLWNIVALNMNWGLRMISHKIDIIADISQKTLGSQLGLKDRFGNMIAVAGDNAGLLTNGLKHTRRWLTQSKVARFVRTMTEETDKWLMAHRTTHLSKTDKLREFNLAVKLYVETGKVAETLPKEAQAAVAKAAGAFRKVVRDELAWAKARGVTGFEKVKASDFYFPRYQNVAQMERIIGKANKIVLADGTTVSGKLQLRNLLKDSIKRANNIDDDAAEILALRVLEFYLTPGMNAPLLDTLIGVQGQSIKEFVDKLDDLLRRSEHAGLGTEEKRVLIKGLKKGFEGKGSSRTMHRIKLDMDASMNFGFGKDNARELITVSSLFETDVTKVAGRYVQDLITHASIQELLDSYATATYKPASITDLFGDITSRLEDAGHARSSFKEDLEGLKNEILNIPHFERKRLGSILQVASQYATMLKLPGFVWAAMPEAAMAQVSQGFLGGVFEQIPYFGKLISEVRGGTAKWSAIQDFVDLEIGMGRTEFDINELYGLWNMSAQGDPLFAPGSRMEKSFLGLRRTQHKFTRWSAFRAQQVYCDTVATRNFFNILVRASKGNKKTLNMFNDVRLAQIGWSREDLEIIFKELRKDGVVTTEAAGRGNVFTVNMDAMDSINRAKFKAGAAENLRQTVQRSSKSDLPYVFITSELGSILTQFRSFAITSQVNHLARNLQAHDAMAVQQMATMTMAGAALYSFQTYARFWDDPKRLEEEMSLANIAAGSMLYSGYMGILPDIIDAGLVLGGKALSQDWGPFFAPGGSHKLMGLRVPALDALTSTFGGIQAISSTVLEGKLTQRNYQKMRHAAPGANMWYMKVLLDYFRDSLPKR